MITLHRHNPSKNMRRFYNLLVEPDLFGGVRLACEYGRIGQSGRVIVQHYPTEQDAMLALEKKRREKVKKGYCIASERK